LEGWYNHHRPFPKREGDLIGGPPTKGANIVQVKKDRLTVYVETDIAERFRNAVYYTPTHETLSEVISLALKLAVRELAKEARKARRKKLDAQRSEQRSEDVGGRI